MSRRSLYRPARSHKALYGPKTDTTIKHWSLEWCDKQTLHEEDPDSVVQRPSNSFKVKMWMKIPDDKFTPAFSESDNDKIDLVDLMKDTANELAIKDTQERDTSIAASNSILPSSTPEVKPEVQSDNSVTPAPAAPAMQPPVAASEAVNAGDQQPAPTTENNGDNQVESSKPDVKSEDKIDVD